MSEEKLLLDIVVSEFTKALNDGHLCLHPSDTLPGLTYDPTQKLAYNKLIQCKQRKPSNPFSALVDSCQRAFDFWEPLPKAWQFVLDELWPAPLTVVWKASNAAPKSLIHSERGTIGLRVPNLHKNSQWLLEVLKGLPYPLPSTSVNIAGEESKRTWDDACSFSRQYSIFIPFHNQAPSFLEVQSTVIEINVDGSFQILRSGAIKEDLISACYLKIKGRKGL